MVTQVVVTCDVKIIVYDTIPIDMKYVDTHCLSYGDMGHGDAQRCGRCGAHYMKAYVMMTPALMT